jgi:hypothetical protein
LICFLSLCNNAVKRSPEEENMGCCSEERNCGCSCHSQQKCYCPCHARHDECCRTGDHSDEPKSHYFLEIADKAWEEVLKEKIKDYILKTENDRMTKLAKIIGEGNHRLWRNKMENKHGCMEFQEELCQFFSHSKK